MAKNDSTSRTILNYAQRAKVFDKVAAAVTKHYYDPTFNGTAWPDRARENRERILSLDDPEAFESAIHELVRMLGTSHTGFFHESVRRVPARLAIGATFRRADLTEASLWMAQDVHKGGPGATAGLQPSDVLISVNGKAVSLGEAPTFSMGTKVDLRILRDSQEQSISVSIPSRGSRKQLYASFEAVALKRITGNIGYLKVSVLPGLLGLDVAREIDAAVEALSSCEGLVLDLRGHVGGGLGVLRLMSHLTPGKVPIGYTVTRKRAELGYDKSALRKLDRLPTNLSNPLAILLMAARFIGRDSSVVLVSEGLGPKPWHSRMAIITNEHTISAGEMVAAFAQQNRLATIVGTETGGRLIPGSILKILYGYKLMIPKAQYIAWNGRRYEGSGIKPDVDAPLSPGTHGTRDNQLEAAVQVLNNANPGTRSDSSRI